MKEGVDYIRIDDEHWKLFCDHHPAMVRAVLMRCRGFFTINELVIQGRAGDVQMLEHRSMRPKVEIGMTNHGHSLDPVTLRLVAFKSSTAQPK